MEDESEVSCSRFGLNDDDKIRTLISLNGFKTWNKIASLIPGRSVKQVKERWQKYLSPWIKSKSWTKEEDELILNLFEKYGNDWDVIARHLDDRNEREVRIRFHQLQNRPLVNENHDIINLDVENRFQSAFNMNLFIVRRNCSNFKDIDSFVSPLLPKIDYLQEKFQLDNDLFNE